MYADSRSAYTVLTRDAAEGIAAVYFEMEGALRSRLASDQREAAEFVRSFDGRRADLGDSLYRRAERGDRR